MGLIGKIKYFDNLPFIGAARVFRLKVAKLFHFRGKYYCAVCESNVRRFLPFGDPPREYAMCPICGSLERHRLDWLMFTEYTDLFDCSPKAMLHVAPEKFFSDRLQKIRNLDYLSADLNNPKAMVKMDVTNIAYPDNTFSIIYCSHVLEHIPNDVKAISEFYRVLKPGGWAVLQVPVSADKTYEDPTIVEPEERKKHFGQWDHVRLCGPDYIDRMKWIGFDAECLRATDIVEEADCARMGFSSNRLIFFCRKPSS